MGSPKKTYPTHAECVGDNAEKAGVVGWEPRFGEQLCGTAGHREDDASGVEVPQKIASYARRRSRF